MENSLAQEHAESIGGVRLLAEVIAPEAVAHAFVASLGSRQLASRSALGSYAFARVLPDHPLVPLAGAYATICTVCGWSRMPPGDGKWELENRRALASERIKWGGVRHLDPCYAAHDLTEFLASTPAKPTEEDWHTLDQILRAPATLPGNAKAADLSRALKSIFRSNKDERGILIRILGYAGVFEAAGYPSFFRGYAYPEDRALPSQRFADWGYPIIWWRARDGVCADAVKFWFPEIALARDA